MSWDCGCKLEAKQTQGRKERKDLHSGSSQVLTMQSPPAHTVNVIVNFTVRAHFVGKAHSTFGLQTARKTVQVYGLKSQGSH